METVEKPRGEACVLMGVAGVGKTTVGRALAARMGWGFRDGDEYHPIGNVQKLRAGIALTDADRDPWYARIAEVMDSDHSTGDTVVWAVSALRSSHRNMVSSGRPWIRWVHLVGARELIESRLAGRKNHFMPAHLLPSQFAALEVPDDAVEISVDAPVPEIVDRIAVVLGATSGGPECAGRPPQHWRDC